MSYTALASLTGLVSMMRINAKAMPINDTNYICHTTAVELFKPITWGPYHTTSYK